MGNTLFCTEIRQFEVFLSVNFQPVKGHFFSQFSRISYVVGYNNTELESNDYKMHVDILQINI
jgi:hypothetical protein